MLRKELGPLLTAFKDAMDGRFPDGIFEAMKRIQRYKRGDRAEDVFGESGRTMISLKSGSTWILHQR